MDSQHLIKQPTRGRACLDHILCGGVNYRSVQIAEVPLKTDHKLISIDVGRSSQPQHISVRKIILPPETVQKLDIPPLDFINLEDDIDKFIEILSEIKKEFTFTKTIRVAKSWHKNNELKSLDNQIKSETDPSLIF